MTMLKSLFLTAAAVISSIAIQAAAQAPIRCRNRKRKWVPTGQKTAVARNQSTASRPTAIATAAYVRSSDICSPIIATANPIARRCSAAPARRCKWRLSNTRPSAPAAHPYGHGYNVAALMRLTAITDVRRRDIGLRVSGVIDDRFGHPPYDDAGGYEHNGYAPPGDLTFRCNVDYSGIVHTLRVHHANPYRG